MARLVQLYPDIPLNQQAQPQIWVPITANAYDIKAFRDLWSQHILPDQRLSYDNSPAITYYQTIPMQIEFHKPISEEEKRRMLELNNAVEFVRQYAYKR